MQIIYNDRECKQKALTNQPPTSWIIYFGGKSKTATKAECVWFCTFAYHLLQEKSNACYCYYSDWLCEWKKVVFIENNDLNPLYFSHNGTCTWGEYIVVSNSQYTVAAVAISRMDLIRICSYLVNFCWFFFFK